MRSLVVPHEQANSHTLLRLELEQVPEREVATLRQRPRRRRLAHKLHLVVHGPADNVYHMVRLEYGVADVLPAVVVLELLPSLELDTRQVPFVDMRVLVQRHAAAMAEREVGVLDALLLGVARDAVLVHRVGVERSEPETEVERGAGLVRPATGADDGEPLVDLLLARGGDSVGGDGSRADELRAEGVVVLDLELEHGGPVRERHEELLPPARLLAVGNHCRARHHRAGHGQRHVRVAGDDLPVVAAVRPFPAPGAGRLLGRAGGGGAAGGEAAADMLGEHVHIGEQPRLNDPQVEVPVEEDGLGRRLAVRRRRHRRRRGLAVGGGGGGGQGPIGVGPPIPGGLLLYLATATTPATRRGFRWGAGEATPSPTSRTQTAKLEEIWVRWWRISELAI